MTAHIIACTSRAQTHDEYRLQVTAQFRSCRIGDHPLKALELEIEVALSDTESNQGKYWRGNSEGSEIEQKVATFLDDNTIGEQVVKEVSPSQVILGREDGFR